MWFMSLPCIMAMNSGVRNIYKKDKGVGKVLCFASYMYKFANFKFIKIAKL